MVNRQLNPLKGKSFFLFGPRGSGKSTFLEQSYSPEEALFLDFLDVELLDDLRLNPHRFEQIVCDEKNRNKIIIVDEVQKFPKILDTVHKLISKEKRLFILTGSSARRLKQEGVNLLAGRASLYHFYPLSSLELGEDFSLDKALNHGLLPEAYFAPTKEHLDEYLKSYVYTYIEKEIQQEQWVRDLVPFRRFLRVAAQMSGKIINRAKIARDVGVDSSTVASYYEILEDTLIGKTIPSFHHSPRKSHHMAPKFYLFEFSIKRALEKTLLNRVLPQTSAYGEAFEHFILWELIKISEYKRLEWQFYYLRTQHDSEIDIIVERPGEKRLMLEIKSKDKVSQSDVKTLETLGYDSDPKAERLLISKDAQTQQFSKSRAMHWKDFLASL